MRYSEPGRCLENRYLSRDTLPLFVKFFPENFSAFCSHKTNARKCSPKKLALFQGVSAVGLKIFLRADFFEEFLNSWLDHPFYLFKTEDVKVLHKSLQLLPRPSKG